jgi:hypothetical protein
VKKDCAVFATIHDSVSVRIGKNERKNMTVINEPSSETEALTIDKCASALGVHEFSLLARIQSGDITAARLRSGEIAIPIHEAERLSRSDVHSLTVDSEASGIDRNVFGIQRTYSGLKRQGGEAMEYTVPDYVLRFTESEINGYRAAFGAIANEYASLTGLKSQLDKPKQVRASSEKEVCTSEIGVWQVRSTLLNLGQSDRRVFESMTSSAV